MSERNAAMGFVPGVPLNNRSMPKELSSTSATASSLPPQTTSPSITSSAGATEPIYTENHGLSHFSQFRPPKQQITDPASIDTSTINQLLETFFTTWHRRWPVLHRPSFDWQSAPWDLAWTIFLTAAKLESYELSHLASALQDDMATVLKTEIDRALELGLGSQFEDPQSLPRMQTYVLYVLFVLYFGEDADMMTHADRLVVGVVQLLRKSGLLHHPSLHEQTAFGNAGHMDQEAWRMVILTTFVCDVYISIMRRRPPTLRYHELCFPLPGDKWLSVAGFEADFRGKTNLSWRTVSSIVQQHLEDAERGRPATILSEIEHHLAYCAIRPRLWEEKLLRPERGTTENYESLRSHQHGHRRTFWRQTLGTWRSQAEKAYWTQQEDTASSAPHNHVPRNSVQTLNSLMNHLSILEMWSDQRAIASLAESTATPGQQQPSAPDASPQDRELIQLQLLIWASSFNGRLAIWHATQILRHFTAPAEFTITVSATNHTLEPVARHAYYSAALVLWAFCLGRRSCSECIATSDPDHQAAHANRPALELSFTYEPDFYTRWIQKEGRFTFEGVVLCQCKKRNVLNKVESAMMRRAGYDAVVRSRSAVLLRLRDHGP